MEVASNGIIYDDRYLLIAIVWEDAYEFLEKENSKLWDYALEAEVFRMKN
ncbi:type II toxin-antitoxin system YafO family toxin [Microbulbifer sp. ZKSA006]